MHCCLPLKKCNCHVCFLKQPWHVYELYSELRNATPPRSLGYAPYNTMC